MVTPEAARKLDEFFCGFSRSARPILLLDYDGTLASIRVDRFKAGPWAGVRGLLARIQEQGRTRTAIVTGRPAAEIAPLLELDPPLEVWGLHGAERLYPDGRRELEQAPAATQAKLDELRELLRRDSLGGLFEDKANGVVMHWRGASRRKAEQIEQRTRELFEPLARLERLALLDFDGGIELRVGRNKGGAVEAILAEAAAGAGSRAHRPVAYLGDDLSDEAAFRAVNRLGRRGLSVLVRRERRETAAAVWLRPPAELKGFLERWLSACSH
ncbi:MAG: trehalose-phosphatase [Terracidiphilus sp.]|jgi:trehalose-phosphatase